MPLGIVISGLPSPPPASSSKTRWRGSAERRFATTQPETPAPTMMSSNHSSASTAPTLAAAKRGCATCEEQSDGPVQRGRREQRVGRQRRPKAGLGRFPCRGQREPLVLLEPVQPLGRRCRHRRGRCGVGVGVPPLSHTRRSRVMPSLSGRSSTRRSASVEPSARSNGTTASRVPGLVTNQHAGRHAGRVGLELGEGQLAQAGQGGGPPEPTATSGRSSPKCFTGSAPSASISPAVMPSTVAFPSAAGSRSIRSSPSRASP